MSKSTRVFKYFLSLYQNTCFRILDFFKQQLLAPEFITDV